MRAPDPATGARRGRRGGGQTLTEFALVLPIFVVLLLGTIEFGFAFHATLSVNNAARIGAQLAATAGNRVGSDCVVLLSVEAEIQRPADRVRTERVEIYRSDANGSLIGSSLTIYQRTGELECTIDGTTYALPYTRSQNGYPETGRCNVLAGCGGSQTRPDHVGVRIVYGHRYVTPLGASFLGGGMLTLNRAQAMRMEPVL
jgi:hypothetical protein